MIALIVGLMVLALGGAAFAFADGGNERSDKRLAAVAKAPAGGRGARAGAEVPAQRRKSVQAALKDFDAKQAKEKKKLTTRRRLDQAGLLGATPRGFWITSGVCGFVVLVLCYFSGMALLVMVPATFAAGFGLPRWVLGFLKRRREKKFTNDFASAMDVIVRSVRSGLPTSDALRIVASEFRDPVGGEFKRLCDGMKMGITLEQGLKRMHESMPTTEVGFFAIVMTVQQQSGGNLSEALSNLANVLRDRKRLLGKIKAMSSEAKASAGIIGSLPPVVMGIVWLTTPSYIDLLFTERTGNLLLMGSLVWMSIGIFVMKKMINFKH